MIKESRGYRIFQIINSILLICVIVVTLFPFLYVLAQSFSSEKYIYAGAVSIFPRGFNTKTYKVVMSDLVFWVDYKNTIIYTLVSTSIQLGMSAMLAYVLSKKNLLWRGFFITFTVFTMFFSGGLIPNYLLVKSLGMRNTIWAVVIPGAISTYNMLIMKTFFEGLPVELEEAAAVDGMGTYQILLKIILPLSKPILATMALFYAVGNWNNWFGPFLYFDSPDRFPVTLYLRNIIATVSSSSSASSGNDFDAIAQVAANIKSATIVLTVLPILCVYPFIQKYFVAGTMIGSLKG